MEFGTKMLVPGWTDVEGPLVHCATHCLGSIEANLYSRLHQPLPSSPWASHMMPQSIVFVLCVENGVDSLVRTN